MNDKWKKKRTLHYDVFEELMIPIDQHIKFREDFKQGLNMVQDAIDTYTKNFPNKNKLKSKGKKDKERSISLEKRESSK